MIHDLDVLSIIRLWIFQLPDVDGLHLLRPSWFILLFAAIS